MSQVTQIIHDASTFNVCQLDRTHKILKTGSKFKNYEAANVSFDTQINNNLTPIMQNQFNQFQQ